MESNVTISFWNDCNLGDTVYEFGFVQRIFLKAFWDTPIVAIQEEIKENGFGNTVVKFRRVAERCVFEACDISDYQLIGLYNIRSHDNITLSNSATNEVYELKDFDFVHREQGNGCDNVGRFSFEIDKIIKTGCCNGAEYQEC